MSSAPKTFDLPVPVQTYISLCTYRGETKDAPEMPDIIAEAVRHWLEQKRNEAARSRARARQVAGYQWKRLFLPHGTLLRTHFQGQQFRAKVEGSRIICDRNAMSPNDFARVGGGSNRNAWRAIWLLFPNENDWILADDCRLAPRARQSTTSTATSTAT